MMDTLPFDADAAARAIVDLRAALPTGRVDTDAERRVLYGSDYSHFEPQAPSAVVYPRNVDEVVTIVKACAKHRVPIVGHGAGTSLEGHVLATYGGVCVSFRFMRKVLSVNVDDLDVVVQPGISFPQLNKHLLEHGLYFPLDAGPAATIGGMVNTSASGTKAVRYGTMKENVLSLVVVLANGSVVRTGGRARKSSAGYDLTHLMVGSEGTLGLVVEVSMRVHRIPTHRQAALFAFPSIRQAADCVIATVQQSVPIAMVELMDGPMLRAINAANGFHHDECPTLYVEFAGTTRAQVGEQSTRMRSLAQQHGATGITVTHSPEEHEQLWKARKSALFAAKRLHARPTSDSVTVWTTDACVPISRLADCLEQTCVDVAASGLPAPLVAHAGDGNFHLFIVFDRSDASECRRAEALNAKTVQRAIAMEGTCTGEHGVGMGKSQYLEAELGSTAVEMMRSIKAALDPQGILNPGKVLPIRMAAKL